MNQTNNTMTTWDNVDAALTKLCGQPFWNRSAAWDGDVPDVGECVERTVLVWTPGVLLLLLGPLVLLAHHKSQRAPLPWSLLLSSKVGLSLVLCAAAVTELVVAVVDSINDLDPPPTNAFLAPAILFTSYVVEIVIMLSCRKGGERSSGVLFTYWFLVVMCGLPRLNTAITAIIYQSERLSTILISTFLVQYIGGVIILGLNFLPETPSRPGNFDKTMEHPEKRVSFVSRMTYQWVTGLVWRGFKKPLTPADLWVAPSSCSTARVDRKWRKCWRKELAAVSKKAATSNDTENRDIKISSNNIPLKNGNFSDIGTKPTNADSGASHKVDDGGVGRDGDAEGVGSGSVGRGGSIGGGSVGGTRAIERTEDTKKVVDDVGTNNTTNGGALNKHWPITTTPTTTTTLVTMPRVSLFRVMFWTYIEFVLLFFIFLVSELLSFISPVILGLLINFANDTTEPLWHGYLYAAVLLAVSSVMTLFKQIAYRNTQIFVLKVRTGVMSAIYRKALLLSPWACKESTVGEIVNLMSVDSRRLGEFALYLSFGLVSPFIIILAFYELWKILGPSVMSGVAVMILLIPVNSVVANKIKTLQVTQMKHKDERTKMVNEIINGIKVLKLYTWESFFRKEVEGVRRKEINLLRKSAFLESFVSFLWLTTPYLVSLASFATFVFVSEDNILDARIAFMSIALFNLMRMPINQFPAVIATGIQARVSMKRVENFLTLPNLDHRAVISDPKESGAVVVRGGLFTWGESPSEAGWKLGGGNGGVEVSVGRGQLVAVVGSVGAGKSSLLAAILGEMRKITGTVIVNGKVGYAAQQAWLQNATLRDNITWGRPWQERRYWRVVAACALQQDLDMLPAGDMTEVGEKGINLSGGQKQRISLARAAYSDADVFLLDDPLSAVDSHVGRHIFKHLIGPTGLMRSKTRILVTHSVWPLPEVDNVLVLSDGEVVEQGKYEQLVATDGHLTSLLISHLTTHGSQDIEEEEEEDLEELCDQRTTNTQSTRDLVRRLSLKMEAESPSTDPKPGKLWDQVKEFKQNQRQRQVSICSSLGGESPDQRQQGSRHQWQQQESTQSSLGAESLLDLRRRGSLQGSIAEGMEQVEELVAGSKLVEDELTETGKVKMEVYRFYSKSMGYLLAGLPILFYTIATGSLAGSNVWLSIYTSPPSSTEYNATTATANTNTTTNTTTAPPQFDRVTFLAGYGGLGVAQSFFYYLGSVCLWIGVLRAGRTIHHQLLSAVLRLPMSFFDTNPSGRVMNRFSKEIFILDSVLPLVLGGLLSCLTQVMMTFIVIIGATPIVALVILPTIVLYFFYLKVYVSTSRQVRRMESVATSPIFSHFSESIQGVMTIRAFKRQDEFILSSQSKIDLSLKALSTTVFCNRWLGVRLESIGNVITFAAAIFSVASRGNISPGIVGLSISYALNVTLVLNFLVRMSAELEANIVSVERIKEYIEEEQEASWLTEPASAAPPDSWPQYGRLTFNNYQTRYRPGLDLVLHGINCTINPSEKVGIVGRTGAGKSSLTLALFRMIEAADGSIMLDGRDIASLGLHDLRTRISIIPQDPMLFGGTIRSNLDPPGQHSDAQLWRALELTHLAGYVRAQPLALMATVEENGSNLSVGQRQLVSLARAVLRKTRILVLDEATAAVDIQTDTLIQQTIREEFSHCTILTIAHRLNTIMDSDRVLVLDKGRIAEFDSPSTLLANKESIFYSMAKDADLVQ